MFKEDRCLKMLSATAMAEVSANKAMISALIEALSFTVEMPFERLNSAVKDELKYLNSCTEAEIRALHVENDQTTSVESIKELLRSSPCHFPRDELIEYRQNLQEKGGSSALIAVLDKQIQNHIKLEKRLAWLMRPLTVKETQSLDPKLNCEEIYHSISYEFRSEMKLFSILYELRAIIAASSNSFLSTTGEFSDRAVKRLVDTVMLFANVLEWGVDSYRGKVCIQRINEIHARYFIPNESFIFILSGIMFGPEDWNRKFGWRPFTQVEKLGWFHAIAKVGREMNIQGISDDYDAMKKVYDDYCASQATYGEIKRKLFDQIVGQLMAVYPEKVRPLILTTLISGMDDIYRTATGYSEPPASIQQAIKAAFFTAGQIGSALPRIPWFRTLQSNFVYPFGYRVDELGVGKRSANLPQISKNERLPVISMSEISKHRTADDLWIVIDQEVYDLTQFSKNHPGGQEILLKCAGTDASEEFKKIKHSEAAKVLMLNYRIGQLGSETKEGAQETQSKCPFSGVLTNSFAK